MRGSLPLAFLLLATLASPAHAQSPDFLFGKPHGTVAVRSGWFFARGASDLFTWVQNQLTVGKRDFNAPALGIDVDAPIGSPRLSIMYGFQYSGSSKLSEYRHFVDNQRLPINQTTQLRESNLSAGLKVALTSPGRAISAHAWIPSAITPYVGAGGGAMRYVFRQKGDFVNVDTLAVQPDNLSSSGWAPSAHIFGGVDVKAWKRLYINGEARYIWSHADLNTKVFKDFKPIDLSGLKVGAGIRYMF
jgi:hypothetical protein